MKYAAAFLMLSGCYVERSHNDPMDGFTPVNPQAFQITPEGHYRLNGVFDESDAAINAAVDAQYDLFQSLYPELPAVHINRVSIISTDFFTIPGVGIFEGFYGFGELHITVSLHSPYYSSLMPLIPHELLHTLIQDPHHTSPLWDRLPKPSTP